MDEQDKSMLAIIGRAAVSTDTLRDLQECHFRTLDELADKTARVRELEAALDRSATANADLHTKLCDAMNRASQGSPDRIRSLEGELEWSRADARTAWVTAQKARPFENASLLAIKILSAASFGNRKRVIQAALAQLEGAWEQEAP